MDSYILATPTWFRVAVQALVVLAENDVACSSNVIAHELKAHATFLRRVMALLVHAQIVVAREGRDGGYRLARPADKITLAEVYQATKAICQPEETTLKEMEHANVKCFLDKVASEVEQALFTILDRYTIASIVEDSSLSSLRS
jgi:Rrf2 family transcriptional repressor of oqxAB